MCNSLISLVGIGIVLYKHQSQQQTCISTEETHHEHQIVLYEERKLWELVQIETALEMTSHDVG